MNDLSEIQRQRKQLGITQAQLAQASGVSQSLIAKIESGRTDPSFTKAKHIWDALLKLQSTNEPLAKDLMITNILTCSPEEGVKELIRKMKRHEISQLPVEKDGAIVGTVSESSLLEHVFDEKIDNLKVSDVMLAAPPTVGEMMPESAILPLLRHFPLVVVMEKGDLKGLITRSDIIMKAYR